MLESKQFLLQFLFVGPCLGVNRVHWENGEVYVNVKFQFLANDISLPERKGYEAVPGYEEVLSFPKIEGLHTKIR